MNTLGKMKRGLETSNGEDDFSGEFGEMLIEASAAKAAWVQQLGRMLDEAPTPEQRESLRQIRMDDAKHLRLLSDMLSGYSGNASARIQAEQTVAASSPAPGPQKAAALKLRSAEFMKRLYLCSPTDNGKDMLLEILLDDTNNAIRLSMM